MSFRFFVIPVMQPRPAEDELNDCLAKNRVLAVERHLVDAGMASFWAVCVSLAPGPGRLPESLKADAPGGRRIDYREVLNEADFAVFAQLRALRKQIAESEGVAQYAVFTNEQLASMVRARVRTREALGAIDGVGETRLDRYAERFLALLAEASGDR
ncbi:HRDC domain-containing protein [Accumulibacter sp.]|uniref:HRDC domain-containing protein n=1 Tax=Accumulibacter sp. TaxID=2053492 RepID=UPI0025FE006A|nr:HRDC domain-containing protein [Accumulibacter sp.]MCM8595753.1 HRDC domain-containing protein [Accumulibacter sp.]MCM8626602.1 HRDC domain-containing protein [Accumulibacter sp.]MDS4049901.1 HRDC domain-containing protein [Accumulibacter sp.]